VALYHQEDDGSFRDATTEVDITSPLWVTGVATGDYDGDGDTDLFLACFGEDRLLENRAGSFRDVSKTAGIAHAGLSTSAVFLDYDADGHLDLYVARYVRLDLASLPNAGEPCRENGVLVACGPTFFEPEGDSLYRGDGRGSFREVTKELGLDETTGGYGLGVASADFDSDGRVDIYVANDTTANYLWMNRGERFEDDALFAGAALSDEGQGQAGMGVALGDANGDGRIDIFVTNYSQERNALYRGVSGGLFESKSTSSGFGESSYLALGWSANLADFDLDGDLDIFVANGHVHPRAAEIHAAIRYQQPCHFFENDGRGVFSERGARVGEDLATPRSHRGSAVGDIDNDGDLDIVVSVQDGQPVILRNESGKTNHTLLVSLEGTRSNRDGLGATALFTVAGKTITRHVTRGGGYLSSDDVRVHCGLGTANRADSVEIRWPSGHVDRLGPLEADAWWKLREGSSEAERVARLR